EAKCHARHHPCIEFVNAGQFAAGGLMKPRDWFGVGVRLTGVWCLLQALTQLLLVIELKTGISGVGDTGFSSDNSDSMKRHMLFAVGYTVIGFVMLLATEALTRWTYREQSDLIDS